MSDLKRLEDSVKINECDKAVILRISTELGRISLELRRLRALEGSQQVEPGQIEVLERRKNAVALELEIWRRREKTSASDIRQISAALNSLEKMQNRNKLTIMRQLLL